MVAVAATAVVAAAAMAVAAAAMVVAATADLEVAATAGSLDAEVAAGSELAGAAAAGSVTSGSVVGGPAAFPGERAACAKSHDLTAGPTEDAVFGLEAPQGPKRRLR